MRQREQVEALAGERQLQRVGGERRTRVERQRETERDPVGTQEIEVRQPGLRGAKAEGVLGRTVELRMLPVENIPSEVAREPFGERATCTVIPVRALRHEGLAIHVLLWRRVVVLWRHAPRAALQRKSTLGYRALPRCPMKRRYIAGMMGARIFDPVRVFAAIREWKNPG